MKAVILKNVLRGVKGYWKASDKLIVPSKGIG
jgi:hypothetical protein